MRRQPIVWALALILPAAVSGQTIEQIPFGYDGGYVQNVEVFLRRVTTDPDVIERTRANESIVPHLVLGAAITAGVGFAATALDLGEHRNMAWVGAAVTATFGITWELANAKASVDYAADRVGWTVDNTEDLAAIFVGAIPSYFLTRWVNHLIWGC